MKTDFLVRTANTNEWKIWKEVRLKALLDSPESFGEHHQDAILKSDEHWQKDFTQIIKSKDQRILFAFIDQNTIGMLIAFTRDANKMEGGIGAVWIDPKYRQRGLGRSLIKEALLWLKDIGMQKVTFWNNLSLIPSSKFYETLGFKYTGIKKTLESNPKFIIGEMTKNL